MSNKITEGRWDSITSWEFIVDSNTPPRALCTAVACIPIVNDGAQVLLTRNGRGWEVPGGHIEPGETLEETLFREALEEAGFVISKYRLFGHQKMRSTRPVPHQQRTGYYPYPIGFIPYFIALTEAPLEAPSGPEITTRRAFAIERLPLSLEIQKIVLGGIEVYRSWSDP